MKSEVILAAVVGTVIGLVVTYGVFTANKAIKEQQTGQKVVNQTIPLPTPKPKKELQVSVEEPSSFSVVSEKEIVVKGLTQPAITVTIATEKDVFFIDSNEEGTFEQKVTLVPGSNSISITVTDFNEISSEKTILLVYEPKETSK